MFFYIGKNRPLQSLAQVDDQLFLDSGWDYAEINDVKLWYKGYSTECPLSARLSDIIDGYKPRGKWCVIIKQDNKFTIKHPVVRGFPLYRLDDQFTNLKLDGFSPIHKNATEPVSEAHISLDEAVAQIQNILVANITDFYRFNSIDKMNILFSGGLDTLTVWALHDSINPNYLLDIYVPKITDKTLNQYVHSVEDYKSDLIDHVRKNYWGYGISRIFEKNNWNITGFYSERFQMREVTNGLALAHFLQKPINSLIEESDYLYWFLQRPNIKMMKIDLPQFSDEKSVKDWCFSSIAGDYQMWHIDNNFHFSPFFDDRITEVMYNLSVSDILLNLRHGIIQKKIIQNVRPEFLQLLSTYKNSKDVFSNFRKNWKDIKLSPNTIVDLR